MSGTRGRNLSRGKERSQWQYTWQLPLSIAHSLVLRSVLRQITLLVSDRVELSTDFLVEHRFSRGLLLLQMHLYPLRERGLLANTAKSQPAHPLAASALAAAHRRIARAHQRRVTLMPPAPVDSQSAHSLPDVGTPRGPPAAVSIPHHPDPAVAAMKEFVRAHGLYEWTGRVLLERDEQALHVMETLGLDGWVGLGGQPEQHEMLKRALAP